MSDQKDPKWVPPWEIMEQEGFLSGNAFEQLLNERARIESIDLRNIKTINIPGAYGGNVGIKMVDTLMNDTGMSAKELIASSSINDNVAADQTVFGTGVLKLAEEVRKQLEQGEYIFMPDGHPGHKPKFGDVTWNPLIKGLESISGPSVLPSCLPHGTVERAITAINEKDTIPTLTLPLTEDMKTLLSNQPKGMFLVDYSTQELQGRQFLAQFIDLPCGADVVFSQPLSYEDYSHLMVEYMLSMDMYDIPTLNLFAAELLLVAKGLKYDLIPYSTSIPKEYIDRFLFVFKIRSDVTLLMRWTTFMDSMLTYGIYALTPLKAHYKPEENIVKIIDENYVGVNVVNLLRLPQFTQWYFSLEEKYNQWIFPHQFNEPIFGGKTLRHYFRSKNNNLAESFEGIAQGHFKPSDVGFGVFTKGVFAPDYPIGEFDFEKK